MLATSQHERSRVFSRPCPLTKPMNKTMPVKGDGDAVGLTDNPNALRRWMFAGPEVARVIGEFEASFCKRCSLPGDCH